jgi:predicted ester cyclase
MHGPGRETHRVGWREQMMLNMCEAMPDPHLTIEDMIAEGDKVVCHNIWCWTDPSGKKMQFHERFNLPWTSSSVN